MKFLRRFHDIISDQNNDFEGKIDSLLRFGLEVFDLDIAIISQVTNEDYIVKYAITPDNSLAVGTCFELEGTYCIHTLKADHALAFNQASASRIANHPCYLNFQLESYIGSPIKVGSEVYGTVNFSAAKASAPFSEQAYDYVELLAQWLGAELARKQSDEQLINKAITLAKLESVANIGTWEIDMTSSQVILSEQTRKIYQIPSTYEIDLDSAITFFKEGKSRDSITHAVEIAIAQGKKWRLELELITGQGHTIWVSSFGEAEFIDNKCVRLFGTLQDVTESVALREELENKRAFAERMLEDRSMLLAKISHELRTPLNGITGMLTTLLEEKNEQRRIEKLKVALRSADILLNIINEVMDFSKINHGELKLEPNHFLLKTIFVDLVSLYIPLFKKNNVGFQTSINITDACWAYCDNTRLSQITSNLLSNALKFTEQGSVKLDIDVIELDKQLKLSMKVTDSGRGMTEEFLESLFSPFTQEVDPKRSRGGSGLGLAIVKELIDYMKGTIDVESTLNKGTTFKVELPLCIGEPQIQNTELENRELDTSTLSTLVVDDNQINRLVLEASLEKINVKADYAVDGQDAIFKCKQTQYDLIFMDCVMPQLDGFEATKILREENICPFNDTLIVALTANTSASDKAACKDAGMDLFISKPFKLSFIEQAVAQAIERMKTP